jgi:SLOG family YspA-like protein
VIAFAECGRAAAFKRAIGRLAARARNGGRGYFPPPGSARLCTAKQNSRCPPSSTALRPQGGAGPVRPPSGDRREGRDRRGRAEKGHHLMTDRDDIELEPPHSLSSTDHVLTELQLYGYRPFQDEPDPRPLPKADVIIGAIADIFDALIATLSDTRLELELATLLWSTVNLFHRAADRVQRELDDNEDAQKRSQKEQDGSELRSVELERLLAEGLTLIERRNSMELFRDVAAEQFEHHTGSPWRPRTGSMTNHRTLTAAMIDSRDFLAAKRRVETEPLLPAGPKIAFTGGVEFNDHRAIWDRLDKVHAKHADMVLLHGGSPKGAERIAACWANKRKVPQIVFKPNWARHGKAAPFKRNDQILDALPIGVIVFPGSGISANLADKAKKLGIPVWKFDNGSA